MGPKKRQSTFKLMYRLCQVIGWSSTFVKKVRRMVNWSECCSDLAKDKSAPARDAFQAFLDQDPDIGDDELEVMIEDVCFSSDSSLTTTQRIDILNCRTSERFSEWASFLKAIDASEVRDELLLTKCDPEEVEATLSKALLAKSWSMECLKRSLEDMSHWKEFSPADIVFKSFDGIGDCVQDQLQHLLVEALKLRSSDNPEYDNK